MDNPDHYAILGVAKTATREEIRTRYLSLASQYHPDKDGSDEAAAMFANIKVAYEVLKDSARRADYDNGGDGAPLSSSESKIRNQALQIFNELLFSDEAFRDADHMIEVGRFKAFKYVRDIQANIDGHREKRLYLKRCKSHFIKGPLLELIIQQTENDIKQMTEQYKDLYGDAEKVVQYLRDNIVDSHSGFDQLTSTRYLGGE